MRRSVSVPSSAGTGARRGERRERSEWTCKPSSVLPHRGERVTVIPLGGKLPGRSSCLPESQPTGRRCASCPAPRFLFGIAPDGVYRAGGHHCRRGALLPHLFTITP